MIFTILAIIFATFAVINLLVYAIIPPTKALLNWIVRTTDDVEARKMARGHLRKLSRINLRNMQLAILFKTAIAIVFALIAL